MLALGHRGVQAGCDDGAQHVALLPHASTQWHLMDLLKQHAWRERDRRLTMVDLGAMAAIGPYSNESDAGRGVRL